MTHKPLFFCTLDINPIYFGGWQNICDKLFGQMDLCKQVRGTFYHLMDGDLPRHGDFSRYGDYHKDDDHPRNVGHLKDFFIIFG